MCEEECITSWNNAISGFKLSSKFFQDCNPSEIKRALEELFRYCGINVDDINKVLLYSYIFIFTKIFKFKQTSCKHSIIPHLQ